MVKKKPDSVSLDDIDPFELDGSPEDIALIKRGIARWEKKLAIWAAVLAGFEKRGGIMSAVESSRAPSAPETVNRRRRGNPYPTEPKGDLIIVEGSWADVVYKILDRAGRPISYHDLRHEVEQTDLGRNMKPDEKPYYAGIQRLKM